MKTIIMKNKAYVLVLILVLLLVAMKISDMTTINEAKAELLAVKETPMYKADKRLLIHMENREIMKLAWTTTKDKLDKIELATLMTESSMRCEKQNKANNTEIDCKKNWKDYPKK